MKNKKKAQAKELYFQGDLTKTEIADRLGVSRRSIHLWVREGDWERLRLSAQHLPSIIAEQCYYTLAHLTRHILSDARMGIPLTHKEADAMHKVALTIGKLKNRSTVNESMEMFSLFLDRLRRRDPQLTEKLLPHVERHISERRDVYISDFLPAGFDEDGYMPLKAKDYTEQRLDEQNERELHEKLINNASARSGKEMRK
jgi:hypothetical protein